LFQPQEIEVTNKEVTLTRSSTPKNSTALKSKPQAVDSGDWEEF
jgi:hypothetical protein